MPELLLQSGLAATKSKQLASEAAQIKANCHAQHGDSKSLISCPDCYETLLEALRIRFFNQALGQLDQPQQQQEWFTTRRVFLSELELLINSAKEYQVSPQAIDDRVREERSRWYAETVRGTLLRLMVEDPSRRGAVFEKLEDLSSATAASDPVALAREVADILSNGLLAPGQGQGTVTDLPERLVAAGDDAAKAEVLKEAFFATDDGGVPEDHQKYLDMLLHQGLSMEQVVDRILEERQAATGAKEQTDKLNQRLDELRRARAAHEAQKTRKAQRRESLAQQKVPDELYELPACAVCGETPSTNDFFCCSICTILAAAGVREKQTVFCSEECERRGHTTHAEAHTCSSGEDCIQLHPQQRQPPSPTSPTSPTTTNPTPATYKAPDEDTTMTDAPPLDSNPPTNPASNPQATNGLNLHFCTECLTTFKLPTTWCSQACAAANYPQHRDRVHVGPEGARDKAGGADGSTDGRSRELGVKDIGAVTVSLDEAVREWEERNRVRLG